MSQPQLFAVSLPWPVLASDDGDYCSSVWAFNDVTAIQAAAEEMAASVEHVDDEARACFIKMCINGARPSSVFRVVDTLAPDIHSMISGPSHHWSKKAEEDFSRVMQILSKYGIGAPGLPQRAAA